MRPPFLAYSKLSGMIFVVVELPQVDVVGPVAGEEQIELAVAVVVEPDGGVGVDPRRQAGRLGDAREALAAVVVEQLGLAPLVDEQILVAVVVVVAPDRPHGDAGAGLVEVGDAHLRRPRPRSVPSPRLR